MALARVLLVPDLPLERAPSMDRYAHRLHDWLESSAPGFEVTLAAHIGELTREARDGRRSGATPRWWARPIDPSRVVLPGPLYGPHRYAARHYFYPRRLRREAKHADLVHILDHAYAHVLNAARRRPVVVTVHDLMPVIVLRSPTDGWREGIRNRFLRATLRALRQADAYLVGTDWLKTELATWLGDDRRISVVPFGVDRAFFADAPGARARGREAWRLPEDAFVILHVGSTVDRKNVPLVLQTVARLRTEADAYLLQVGGRFTAEQEQLIDRLSIRRFVRSVPAADEATLHRAYRAADVLLFPSLYEGFGFPVLEAFASGLPVVTSGAGGLREVGGDAAVVVEAREAGAYVQALESLSADPEHRDALVARGMARAREFTWQRTASQTAEVYRRKLSR
ncbi:MAG TPA: glycosyltransferase family 1 protein [Gemmatimonadales bacterium]|nr:glycosyltransferase family 1 protein [Gemmatimonadales bacterium]